MAQTLFPQMQQGELLEYSDLNTAFDSSRNLAGEALQELLGASSAQITNNAGGLLALTAVAVPSNLQVTVGGTGQAVFVQGRVCDNCPSQVLTFASNSSGSSRTDLIEIQYSQTTTNGTSRNFKNPTTGAITSATVYQINETCAFQVKQGSTTPDSGWVAFAQVVIPNLATSIGSVTIVLPTMASLLAAALSSYLTTAHGVTTTTVGVTIPTILTNNATGTPISLTVADATGFPAGSRLLASDGTNSIACRVVSVAGSVLSCILLGVLTGAAGNTLASNAVVTFGGVTDPYPVGITLAYQQRISSGQSMAGINGLIPSTTGLITLPPYGQWTLRGQLYLYAGQSAGTQYITPTGIQGSSSVESPLLSSNAASYGGLMMADILGLANGYVGYYLYPLFNGYGTGSCQGGLLSMFATRIS